MMRLSRNLKFKACFMASVIITAFIFNNTYATVKLPTGRESEWAENNILFYNPGCSRSSMSGGRRGYGILAGGEIKEMIWNALKSVGFTDAQAAAAIGNMSHESGLNPVRHLDGARISNFDTDNYAIGLVQWTNGRRHDMLNYIKMNDPDLIKYFTDQSTYGTIQGDAFLQKATRADVSELIRLEVEFLRDEVNSKYTGFNNDSTKNDVTAATRYFLEVIEAPGGDYSRDGEFSDRYDDAENAFNEFGGTDGGIIGGDSYDADECDEEDENVTECSLGGGLQAYVLCYAWPEYHDANFFDMMPEYEEAVRRRMSEGKYVGGGEHPGIDCGGFVTTLLQESGYEPDYNSGAGYNSATPYQLQWAKAHWTRLDTGGSVDPSKLRPGDVAFYNERGGHTFVYVGTISGFGSQIASASWGSGAWRSPMADTKEGYNHIWYGKR